MVLNQSKIIGLNNWSLNNNNKKWLIIIKLSPALVQSTTDRLQILARLHTRLFVQMPFNLQLPALHFGVDPLGLGYLKQRQSAFSSSVGARN
jgi:hypothetical protein